jgi:hypothetical protein
MWGSGAEAVGASLSPPGRVPLDTSPDGGVASLSDRALLDHLIRQLQERRRNRQAESLGGLEVDDQLELGWLHDGSERRDDQRRPPIVVATTRPFFAGAAMIVDETWHELDRMARALDQHAGQLSTGPRGPGSARPDYERDS